MKIGIITDCLKKSVAESISICKTLGANGVQIYATGGEFSPDGFKLHDKSYYKNLLSENGLEVSALCADMGGHGFEIEANNAERIEMTKRIIDLAVYFGASVATTHIGVIPSDKSEPRYSAMLKALTECGLYAKTKGLTLAIETGPESAKTLLAFLKDTKGGVGVNLDPANFVMVTGQDPVEAVYLLKDYIVHTHAKDGIKLKEIEAKIIYDHFANGGIKALNVSDYFIETPLGEGRVDFEKYIAALKDIGYDGYLTIEREAGEKPEEDVKKAVSFLQKLI